MDLLVTFFEGVITFVSPCLLPMLPLYVAYFAGASTSGAGKVVRTSRVLANALGFVLGFAGAFGGFLTRYRSLLDLVAGLVVVAFGLCFMGALRIPLLNRTLKPQVRMVPRTFPSAVLFGIVFSIGWTPCVGAYLGSALLLASTQASAAHGVALLLAYSLGLGLPFVLSAVAIDRLSAAFDFIKEHYAQVNAVCGALLVVVGLLMATGLLNVWLGVLSA
jgi:cytochrome c-type biogenesis protein